MEVPVSQNLHKLLIAVLGVLCWSGPTFAQGVTTVRGTVTADTEMPAAAALADNTSNPTVPGVAAFLMCYDGSTWDRCQGGLTDTDDGSIAGSQVPSLVLSLPQMWNGSAWVRLLGDATNGLTVNLGANNDVTVTGTVTANLSATDNAVLDDIADGIAVTNAGTFATQAAQSGTWNITNVTGTVSLPTGASTAAKQPALGTAGTASSDVITVQGIASMTPLLATVTATNLDVQSGGADLATEATLGTILTSSNFAAAFGTAGSADSQVMSVQGITSMTPLQVQSNSANLATETTLSSILTSTNFANAFGTAGSADSQVMSVQGIASMTPLLFQPQAIATGGADGLSYISAGSTEDEHAVKATAGTLYSVTATNTNAAVRYLKCENDTAANTAPGTDTPEFRMAIPGATTGAGFTVNLGPTGWAFSTALTCWLVTGAADSDVAEVAANEIMVFYSYK